MTAPIQNESRRPAAVLLLVYPRGGEYHTVFTKRTQRVRSHKGEVSLPGGAWEPSDRSLLMTALRETWEELGVDPTMVTPLGELGPIQTRGSNYEITPFVGLTERSPDFHVQADEVDTIIELPLRLMDDPAVIRTEPMLIRSEMRAVTYFSFEGHTIWGATARILLAFREQLMSNGLALPDGRPLREVILKRAAR